VLTKFKQFHITVNIDKCKFFLKEVAFLGHIISTEGLKMDPEKIKQSNFSSKSQQSKHHAAMDS